MFGTHGHAFRSAIAVLAFTWTSGLPANADTSFTTVADGTTPIPGWGGTFERFDNVAIDGDEVAFRGIGNGQDGIYKSVSGYLAVVADQTDFLPGGTDLFHDYGCLSFDGQSVAFYGLGYGGSEQGIYTDVGGSLQLVANKSTIENFNRVAIDQGVVVFSSTYALHKWETGNLSVILDTSDLVPGSTDVFESFGGIVSLDGSDFAFRANRQAGAYASIEGTLVAIAERGDSLPGGIGEFFGFGPVSLDDGQVAFFANATNPVTTGGVFAGTAGELRTVADSNTQIPEGVGNFTGLTSVYVQDGLVVFRGSGSSGQKGIYTEREGDLQKVIDRSDSLVDGKIISSFAIWEDAVSGSEIAFRAIFDEDTENPTFGIYIATVPEPSATLLSGAALITLGFARRASASRKTAALSK